MVDVEGCFGGRRVGKVRYGDGFEPAVGVFGEFEGGGFVHMGELAVKVGECLSEWPGVNKVTDFVRVDASVPHHRYRSEGWAET